MSVREQAAILYVDDEEVTRRSLTGLLRRAGFATREAATGGEALRLAADKPDLIILDVNLPDIDGFEVCRRIKAHPATAAIPVLHVSGVYVRPEDKAHGLEGGADGYLTKPAEPQEVVATVKSLLAIHRDRAAARAEARQWQATFEALHTERRALRDQLRQARKLEAIGRLAGGVAHDFNNLLTVITGNLSLLRAQADHDDPRRELLLATERAAEQAGALTRQLLGSLRPRRPGLRPLELNGCIRETMVLVRGSIGPRIEVEVHCAADLWPVRADPTQMSQVLLNLCLNARDAMPGGGRLRVEAENMVLGLPGPGSHPERRSGEFVRLRVRDTGHGIPPGLRSRVFEPFFTTKGPGQGTGLGLSLVAGIVQQHHGWIECSSAGSEGTCFDVYLPRHEPPGPDGPAAPGPVADRVTRCCPC
jgi:signal transduction histidine kinase